MASLDDGLSRIRVQLNLAEFQLGKRRMSETLVPVLMNCIAERLLARGLRPTLFFNSVADASEARVLLREDLRPDVAINVLGLGDFSDERDVAVLLCPSNEGNGNLQRIEEVERIIYAGPPRSITSRLERKKFLMRPIVLFNPVLEAVHAASTDFRKVPPMFLSDFTTVYFLQPHVRTSRTSELALLRAHPSHWQLWMRRNTRPAAGGAISPAFRVVGEKATYPSETDMRVFHELDDAEDRAIEEARRRAHAAEAAARGAGRLDAPRGRRRRQP